MAPERGGRWPVIEAINLSRRLALTEDGETVPIVGLLDADGEDTDDIDAAVAFTAGSGGRWFSGVCACYESVGNH